VLLTRGCLWNTFVTIGRAEALLQLVCAQIPDVVDGLSSALACNRRDLGYEVVRAVDFSHDVLAHQPHRLLVVRDQSSGWADLGNPTRVIDTLARNGINPPWVREMRLVGGASVKEFDARSQNSQHQESRKMSVG